MSGAVDPSTNGEKKDTRIKPGEVRNPHGRPKGSRHKLGEDFLRKLQQDFASHGEEVIQKVRGERPQDYLKVVASILPKEIELGEEMQQFVSEITRKVVDHG